MFGATTTPPSFNVQTLATMINFQQQQQQLSQPILPQLSSPKLSFSPETNFLSSFLQEASKFQPFLPSLQDLIIQNAFLNLLQAQSNVNAKVVPSSPPPPPPPPTQLTCQQQQISIPSSRSPIESSRKRPNSSTSNKKSFDDSDSSNPPAPKRTKQMRKLASEDAETNSPVSGMHIKDMSEVSADDIAKAAELDETASFVVVSEETRRKLAEIPDVIKSTNCALCKVKFDDVIHLARHKCPRIVHEEYKCSECEKIFSCPANLASHKRWHGPRPQKGASTSPQSTTRESSTTPSETSTSKIDIFNTPAIQLFSENFLALQKSSVSPKEEVEIKIKTEVEEN